VLWPVSLVDLTFRLAEIGYHEVLWTEDLLREITRVLVDYKGLPAASADRFCQQIRATFPTGEIRREVYEDRVARQIGPDPDDHVHSAAASEGGATILLTSNTSDFPDQDVKPCVVSTPDDYYCAVLDDDPELVELTLEQMSSHLTRRSITTDDLIDSLERAGCPRFANRLRDRKTLTRSVHPPGGA
jgi:hypothetical protein